MELCPFINLIFLSYWFAVHAETLDNHFTTVMMNIMKMVLLTDLRIWFCSFCCCCCCIFYSTKMSDEGKFVYALNSTNEWNKKIGWKNTTGHKMPFKWKRRARERDNENRQQWDFTFVMCILGSCIVGPRHCFIFHVWLPFSIDTPPYHHSTTHRNISNSLCSRMLRWNSFKKEICQPIQFNSSVAWPLVECGVSTIFNCCECRKTNAYAGVGDCAVHIWFSVCFPPNWHFHNGSAFYGSIFMLSLSDFGRVPSLTKDYLLPIYGWRYIQVCIFLSSSIYLSLSLSLSFSVCVSLYPIFLCVCQLPYFVADLSLVCYESLYFGLLFWQFSKVVLRQRRAIKNANKRSRKVPMAECMQQQFIVKV